MPTPNHDATPPRPTQPPDWAIEQAVDELSGETGSGPDAETVAVRARAIVLAREERAGEQHDEYDDPDRGGEG